MFWDGWFNRWKEPIITRDPKELAASFSLSPKAMICWGFKDFLGWLHYIFPLILGSERSCN
ncbi:hypothetical protein, partial [Streptococcus pseudopneumoniae]